MDDRVSRITGSLHSFPPELLEMIFFMNSFNDKQHPHDPERTSRATSQVCRAWRTISLACAELWGNVVDFYRMRFTWTQELLKRSDPKPLNVVVHLGYRETEAFALWGLEYLHRARIVDISGLQDVDELFMLVEKPAPVLESFKLQLTLIHHEIHLLAHFPSLSRKLFGLHAPRLRQLDISKCLIPFDAPVISHLTHLALRDIPHRFAPTIEDWLNVLHRVPHLQSLIISEACNYLPGEVDSLQNINMPHLRFLHIVSTEISVCAYLLKHIFSDHLCSLKICCGNARPSNEYRIFHEQLMERLRFWSPSSAGEYFWCLLNLQGLSFRNFPNIEDGLSSLDIRLSWDSENHNGTFNFPLFSPLLSEIVTNTYLSEAKTIVFDSELELKGDLYLYFMPLIKDILHGLNQPSTIELRSETIAHMVLDTLMDTSQFSNSNTSDVLLPTLRAVVPRSSSLHPVLIFLHWREAMGYGLVEIDLAYCQHEDEEMLNFLQEIGINIVGIE